MDAPMSPEELVAFNQLSKEDLSRPVVDDALLGVSKNMDRTKIAPYLGLTSTDQNDIEETGKSPQQKRMMTLEKWKQKYGPNATYFKLIEVFCKAERQDLAGEICKFFKENHNHGNYFIYINQSIAKNNNHQIYV